MPVTRQGESYFLSKLDDEDLTARLWVNNFVPDDDSVFANFTEMSTLNYSAKTVLKGNWTQAVVSGQTVKTNSLLQWNTFSAGTSVQVYGIYYCRSNNDVVGYKQFLDGNGDPAPKEIGVTGQVGKIEVTPKFGGD